MIFHAASLSPSPWLSVRKIANNEPLWYGKDGEEPFNYEASEWHQRHVRFSDEIKDSDGETHTLQGSSSPDYVKVSDQSNGSGSDDEKPRTPPMPDDQPRDYGEDAAPSPVISRTSRDKERRALRSAGRGH